LVSIRNCAWLPRDDNHQKRIVWARGGVTASNCPKSIISSESLHFLEQFRLWKSYGGGVPWTLNAREAEALLVLDREWRKEENNETT
jgi:hypothetical protein